MSGSKRFVKGLSFEEEESPLKAEEGVRLNDQLTRKKRMTQTPTDKQSSYHQSELVSAVISGAWPGGRLSWCGQTLFVNHDGVFTTFAVYSLLLRFLGDKTDQIPPPPGMCSHIPVEPDILEVGSAL